MAPGLNDEANNAPVSFPSGDTSVAAITSAIEKVLELEAALFRSCSMSVQVFARSVAADKPGSAKTRPSSDIVGRSVVKFIPKVLEVEADGPAVCSDPFVKPSSNPSSNAAINKYSSPLDVQREIAHGARQRLMNSAVAGIALVLVAPGGQLYVTTEEHNAKQVALGLGQCRGCGAFFSHPRARGLKTHQLLSNTKSSTGQCIAAGLAREEREAQFAEEEREAQRQGSGTATSESQAPNFDNICIAGSNADRKKGPDDNSKGSEDESGLLRRLAISSKHQAPWREAQRNSQLAQPPPLPHSPLESGDKSDKTCANSSSTTAAALSTSEHLSPGLAAARDGALATLLELAQGPGGISTVAALVDKHGCGPLMWAAGSGHLACVQWLVRICGCDPATPAKRNGRLPLHWASRNGHLEVIQWLVKGDQYYHREVAAVEEAGSEIKSEDEAAAATAEETPAINSLYQGMSPETPTFDGDTAFMLAAWQGHLHVCQWLVAKCGSNSTVAHAVNRWGCNAAFKAARMDGSSSTLEVLKFVLDIGVDASLVNAARHSLLHKAAIYGRRDVCEYLLEGRLCEEHEDAKEGGDTTTTSLSNAAFSGGYVEAAVRRRTKMPKAVGLPLGRAHVLPDLRNQTPSEMARYNGFPALAAYLRHHEDLLWHVPIVWQPPLDVLKASLENCD